MLNRNSVDGVVEFVDSNSLDNNTWNCLDFWLFSGNEDDKSWDASHARFLAAKSGNCPYKGICLRYVNTILKIGGQLKLGL